MIARHFGRLLALTWTLAAAVAGAQPAPTTDTVMPPPLAASERDRNDAVARVVQLLEQRVLTADDANSHWIAAQFAKADPTAAAAHLKAAFEREPRNVLFLASLAFACARPTSPVLAVCAATDYLSQWSFRDEGNALPWLLLAERSRRRGDAATMVSHLERAARGPRYDDYWGRAVGVFALAVNATPAIADPDLAALVTLTLAVADNNHGLIEFALTCEIPRAKAGDPHKAACDGLARLMAERATTLVVRGAGVRYLDAFAGDDAARAAAAADRAAYATLQQECGSSLRMEGLAAADAAVRRAALADYARWLAITVKDGEVAACAAVRSSANLR
jgi:hypothetical protein